MEFGTVTLEEAEGGLLVHSLRIGGRLYKKGRRISKFDMDTLREAGIQSLTVVRLDYDDVGENEAAERVAKALSGPETRIAAAFTGRANLYATKPGVLIVDRGAIDDANLVHESLTLATLAPFAPVAADDMVATVKIIPFAAPEACVARVEDLAAKFPLRVAPYIPKKAALISTVLPGMKEALLDKNRTALEARLTPLLGTLVSERRVAHDTASLAAALRETPPDVDIIFVFGASAITDRRDVIPAGITEAGGAILHFGMPVDPGNLLLLGAMGKKPVIGLPSCARSPKFNGFDFVLQRVCAGLNVSPRDIMRMGVGGLLSEIPSRPQLRDPEPDNGMPRAPRIAGIVLAAGLSSRMGANKLLEDVAGTALLRRTVKEATKSVASPLIVVTGHESERIEAALAGLSVRFVRNPNYVEGLSTSLRAGIAAVPETSDGALVLLGDMPEVSRTHIDRMIAAFSPADGRAIIVATHGEKRGNPVLWARRFFAEMENASGDTGAKHLIGAYDDVVCEIETDEAVLTDIDTPEALSALRARTLTSP